jgi:hypothetical protein
MQTVRQFGFGIYWKWQLHVWFFVFTSTMRHPFIWRSAPLRYAMSGRRRDKSTAVRLLVCQTLNRAHNILRAQLFWR